MMNAGPVSWFDAHLDLAYLAVCGRDMRSGDLATCGGPDLPAAVTLATLREGWVRRALGTVFTEADGHQREIAYASGDVEGAHRVGVAQLCVYEEWARAGEISVVGGKGGAGAMRVGVLVEGADPIREPSELGWWKERGVVAVGLAWAKASRYAGGNATEMGLTELGRGLVREMDRLGVVHDVSHLSDAALAELLRMTDRPVIASHSNCRAILTSREVVPGPGGTVLGAVQRQLADETIREIVRRGGMIGLNLYSPFLIPGGWRSRRATIDEAVAHVEHVCELAGDRLHVGLGSDMDGGFSMERMPEAIDRPSGLMRLAEGLAARGWTNGEIAGFARGNWERFFAGVMPGAFASEAT